MAPTINIDPAFGGRVQIAPPPKAAGSTLYFTLSFESILILLTDRFALVF